MAFPGALRPVAPRAPGALRRIPVCRALPPRRHLKTHHGPKYQEKIDEAERQWKERKQLIEEGKLPHLWDMFEERGYVKDVAGTRENIRSLMLEKRIGAYVGIDPTASSLHLGHLLPLMPLYWMYLNGYRAFSLLGGATAKIGDPTGRLTSREDVHREALVMNLAKIHFQLKRLWANVDARGRHYGYEWTWAWKRGTPTNGHWWTNTPMLEVLRRLGTSLRLGPMMSRETVKRKMTEGDGMSYAEFSYPIMQAWDFWKLYQSEGVRMQIGGSDQYGNIVMGVDAVKTIRETEPNPAFKLPGGPLSDPVGFTVPLLTDSSGAKFGKSAGNAIWLDSFLTTQFDLYGYFMRQPDDKIESLLKLFTFMPTADIHKVMEEHSANPPGRAAHHALAYEVLCLVHGENAANQTREAHRAMYDKGSRSTVDAAREDGSEGAASEYVAEQGHPTTLNNAPRVDMKLPMSLVQGGKIARILYAAHLAESVSAANRLAVQKGVYIGASPGQKAHSNKGMPLHQLDFLPVTTWFPHDTKNFIIDGKYLILRRGKHNLRVVELVSDDEWAASGLTYPGEPGKGKVRGLLQEMAALRSELADDAAAANAADEDLSPTDEDLMPTDQDRTPADDKVSPEDDGEPLEEGRLHFPTGESRYLKKARAQLKDLQSRAEKVIGASPGRARKQGAGSSKPRNPPQHWMRRGSQRRVDGKPKP